MADYAVEFREFRNTNDLSQAMLAKALGVALRTVQHVEHKEHEPSYTTRFRFKALKKRYEEANAISTENAASSLRA